MNRPMSETRELTEILIKHYDLHEGFYRLVVEFGFGAANLGPSPEEALPSGITSVKRVGLDKVDPSSPSAVDAATVNPAPSESKPRKKKSAPEAQSKTPVPPTDDT